jgi:hypothetical protein
LLKRTVKSWLRQLSPAAQRLRLGCIKSPRANGGSFKRDMSDDSIGPGIDDQLIGDFLVERATINPAHIIEHDMIICPSFAATRKVADFGLFIQPR